MPCVCAASLPDVPFTLIETLHLVPMRRGFAGAPGSRPGSFVEPSGSPMAAGISELSTVRGNGRAWASPNTAPQNTEEPGPQCHRGRPSECE